MNISAHEPVQTSSQKPEVYLCVHTYMCIVIIIMCTIWEQGHAFISHERHVYSSEHAHTLKRGGWEDWGGGGDGEDWGGGGEDGEIVTYLDSLSLHM